MLFFLIMALEKEDREKFEWLYENYSSILFYVANDILKDEHLSEDAINSTFIKVIFNLDNISDVNSHRTKRYLITIIKNIARQMYNKRKKGNVISLEDVGYEIKDNDNLEERAFSHFADKDFLDAVELLKDEYRDILRMKYVLNLLDSKIAEILDISEVNVRKRTERARKSYMRIVIEGREKNHDQ